MAEEKLVTVSQLAQFIGCSDRKIQMMAKAGHLPKVGRGKYPFLRAVQAYIVWQEAQIAQKNQYSETSPDIDEARRKNLDADTRLKELKEQQIRRETAPISVIESALGHVGARIAAILESIPAKVKRRLPKLTASEVEVIKREIIKAQNAAADADTLLADWKPDGE